MMILKRNPVTLTSTKSYSKKANKKLFTKSRKFHKSTINCTLMSPSVAKTPKKVRNYWEDELNRHQSEKKTNKTKVIEGKQKQTKPVFVD